MTEPSASVEAVASRTFRLELARAVPLGVLETLMATFAVLIAMKQFDVGPTGKALLLGASQIGLMASLGAIPVMHALGRRLTTVCGWLGLVAAAGMIGAAVMNGSAAWYVGGISFGFFVFMVQTPLLTQMYQTNYPAHKRGRLFSIVAIARGVVAVGFGLLAGSLLDADIGNYRPLLWVFAAAGVGSALCLFPIPSGPVPRQRVPFFRAFRWVREDRLFRNLLIAWMLVGLANLTGFKLYVEYLASPRFGHAFSPKQIAFLTVTLLFGTKLATTLFWGVLFDRMNFYLLRVVLNTVFAAAMLLVFLGTEMWVIALGMCVQGLAFAGGNIAWSLWVTKIAPPERVGEYMSVHTFLTGVRGAAAPFIGYWLLDDVGISPGALGIGCAALMMVSNATLWSEVRFGKARRKGVPLAPRDPGP